jgi:hypothetical protein
MFAQKYPFVIPAALFLVSGIVLWWTMVPTLYGFDSAELVVGAKHLAIVHAPGYPLYLLIAHGFTYLPFGDIAYRVNLFSVICLAGSVSVVYLILFRLLQDHAIAVTSSLMYGWSLYIWASGLVAEIYAPQLLTLGVSGWLLVRMMQEPDKRTSLAMILGAWFGITLGMVPSSIFFALGLVVAYRLMRIPMWVCLVAAGITLLVFSLSLLYFPLRYAADPVLNLAGEYNAEGVFQKVNLQTPEGIVWMLTAQQFGFLFFDEGVLPSPRQLESFLGWFLENYLVVGVAAGCLGLWVDYRRRRAMWWCWLVFFLPFTYFYTTYGAQDRETMFGPTYLLWAIPMGYGIRWMVDSLQQPLTRYGVLAGLVMFFLAAHFPLVDNHQNYRYRHQAEQTLQVLPPNALVFGGWLDLVPMQYLQIMEQQRPDLRLYNLFLFKKRHLIPYVEQVVKAGNRPVIFLGEYEGDAWEDYDPRIRRYAFTLDGANGEISYVELRYPPQGQGGGRRSKMPSVPQLELRWWHPNP